MLLHGLHRSSRQEHPIYSSGLVTVIMALRKSKPSAPISLLERIARSIQWGRFHLLLTLKNTPFLQCIGSVSHHRPSKPSRCLNDCFWTSHIFSSVICGDGKLNKSSTTHLRSVWKEYPEFVNGFVLVGVTLPVERSSLMAIVPPVLITMIFFIVLLLSFIFFT